MHAFSPFYMPYSPGFLGLVLPLVLILALATIILKGFSLWYAARSGNKYWFIALLVINTVGILEIVYLLFFRPGAPYKNMTDGASSVIK